jgi:transcriptional regulator of acetoin/glycerol metabolism
LLIGGESGVGKDWFAQAVHQCSQRRDRAWVAVNCAALPESLIEAELFGYAPGAFTGASRQGSVGRIREADAIGRRIATAQDGERVGIPATVEIDAAFAAKVGAA